MSDLSWDGEFELMHSAVYVYKLETLVNGIIVETIETDKNDSPTGTLIRAIDDSCTPAITVNVTPDAACMFYHTLTLSAMHRQL